MTKKMKRVPAEAVGANLGKCPFCDAQIGAAFDADGEHVTGVLHGLPMCEDFGRQTAEEFIDTLSAIRRAQAFDPSGRRGGDA